MNVVFYHINRSYFYGLFTSEVDPHCGLLFLQDNEKVELKTSLTKFRHLNPYLGKWI